MTENEMKTMQDKLEKLTNDSEFMEKLGNLEGLDEIAKALTEAGVPTTANDVKDMMKMANARSESDELDFSALESVAGGSGMTVWDFLWNGGKACINFGIAIGNKIFNKNCRFL